MESFKIIITGATGMVGEGVLLHCLENQQIKEILLIGRKQSGIKHAKLKELIVSDFNKLGEFIDQISDDYKACFYCAGISSVGMNETDYTQITYTQLLILQKRCS